MKAIATLRYHVNEMLETEITTEILQDLGFSEVLEGSWKLKEEIPGFPNYVTIIYIRFNENNVADIEANNIYGNVKFGNYYINQGATLRDLLNIVELLKA